MLRPVRDGAADTSGRKFEVVAALKDSLLDESKADALRVDVLALIDAEVDIVVVDTASPAVRAAWSDQANAMESQRIASLRKHRIDRLSLGTGDDFVDELRRFFQRREARRGR